MDITPKVRVQTYIARPISADGLCFIPSDMRWLGMVKRIAKRCCHTVIVETSVVPLSGHRIVSVA